MKKILLRKLIARGKVNLTTGCGTGLIPWYDLIIGGYYKWASRRMIRALTKPGLAWRLASDARKYRTRLS